MDERGVPSIPISLSSSPVDDFKKPPTHRRGVYFAVGLIVLAVIVGIVYSKRGDTFSIKTEYSQIYKLVNDKVSASAPIQINLPKGTSKGEAGQNITFEPALEGAFVDTKLPDVVVFKPLKKLEAGKYYTVALVVAGGEVVKDFQADEDPAIVDIFPNADSEADESSAITIVFNRPMSPLSSLGELEKKAVPVTITPETEGRFKWISTRSLQFIPKTTLVHSANYEVKVNPGFVSMDGLAVEGITHKFTTRPLRSESYTKGTIRYNQPIEFRFNQPVDIEKTTREISLTNSATGTIVPFHATYGQRLVYDSEIKENITLQDRSVISILPQRDKLGRANLWDFENNYSAGLSKAYPVGGDIIYSGDIRSVVTTTGVIQSVTADSPRTNLASPELFDPQGKVTIAFYEDVDLKKSDIEVKGLKTIEYGQKCAPSDTNRDYYYNAPCEKVDDFATLIFSFEPDKFTMPGESVPIRLKRVVNAEGLTLDTKEIAVPLSVYPQLKIYKVTPASGAAQGSVSELTLCTNSPLQTLSGDAFHSAIKADDYIVLGRWNPSYLQTPNVYEQNPPCAHGHYVNVIRYGLLPEKPYTLTLALSDVFGQTMQKTLSFTTERAPKFYLRFHALDKIYNVTTPEKTKLTYAVENFDYVNMHICKVDPLVLVRYLAAHPSNTKPGEGLTCIDTAADTVPLPPKLWVNNYFHIDVADYFPDPRGQFVLSFTNPRYTDSQGRQLYERTYVSVTNLAVAEKRVYWTKYDSLPQVTKDAVDAADPQGELYWVSRIKTLAPETDATVSVVSDPGYAGAVPEVAQSGRTDASGIATFPLIKDVVGATITSGADTAIVSAWADTINRSSGAYSGNKIYLYTDRPIYRPGQEVFIKGIYRFSYDGSYQFDTDFPIEVTVTDSRGSVVYRKNASVGKYGTFNASLKLPPDAAHGGYYIEAMNQYTNFNVEEYTGAAFEAKAQTQTDEYIAGNNAEIDVSGTYYFGVPVDGAAVAYTFTAQNYYFDRYTDEYFNFGSGWYSCYECGYGDTYIKSGQTTLDANGKAHITQALDFNTLFGEGSRDSSKIIVFHATITDGQGKSVSTQKSFIVHRGEFYLGAKADPSFVGANREFALRLKTVDTEGEPIRQGDIEIVMSKAEWKSFKRQEVDGNYYNRTERVLTPVITKRVHTDGKGDYSDTFKLESPGEYDIFASATDSKGNTVQARGYLYVYGQGSVSVRPTNNATLDITAERTDLSVGDTARILFQSPYPFAKALITLERGRIFDYSLVDITRNVHEQEFQVTSDFSPNVYASVLLLSPDPEVKFGQVQFNIGREEKELHIAVATDKSSYLPGEKVNLKITTTDVSGRRIPAEVSVAVADLSVLALQGNPKKDPLVFFYNGFPLAITTATNVKNILTEAQIPTGTKGGGGSNPADLAKRQRGEFKDTAFWSAQIETDANGEANASFTLPDNLTRWQIETLGVTEDSKVGVKYQEITAQKRIMLVPLRPRFVVPGDEFDIGAQVFNQTDRTQSVTVSYESLTLGITSGGKSASKKLKAGESATLYWSVKAPESQTSGAHTIVLSAKSNEFEDTVQNIIPVNSNITYESVATANSTEAKTATEYVFIPDGVLKDRGGLTVKASATLAVFLSDALKYLVQFPYGGSEQLASKLSSIAIVKKGLAVKNVGDQFNIPPIQFDGNTYTVDEIVAIGLGKIYDAQTSDGGFSYYRGLPSDLYLTINMVNALKDLEEGGYSIDTRVLRSAANYIGATLVSKGITYHGVDAFISGAYAISRSGGNAYLDGISDSILSSATASFLNEKASSMTLGYLALLSNRDSRFASLASRVFTALENRVDIDSRGAYVASNASNITWRYYETPIKSTALFLKALAEGKRGYTQTDKLLRWLLSSRSADGAWGSTQNTLSVIDAFTEYLSWKRETESDFALALSLDGVPKETFNFNKGTVVSIFEKFLPLSSFTTNTMHTISFEKENRNNLANAFYYDMGLTYYLPAEQIPPRDEGITIERNLYGLLDVKEENPVVEAKVGEVLRGKITVITGKPRHLFAIEDFIPAGFELVNFNLATEDSALLESQTVGSKNQPELLATQRATQSGFFAYLLHPIKNLAATGTASKTKDLYDERRVFKSELYPDWRELHDDRLFLFKQELPAGQYTYEYYLRATTPGVFRHLPAVASELYFPENFGRTGGSLFRVSED